MSARETSWEGRLFTVDELLILLPILRKQIEREDLSGALAHLDKRVVRDELRPKPVCPRCGYRTSWHKRTGGCMVCHLRAMEEEARALAKEIETRRHLESAQRQLRRAMDACCSECHAAPEKCSQRNLCFPDTGRTLDMEGH